MNNNYYHLLPDTGFVRLSTILKIIPVGKTTWYEGIKTGRFPKSVRLGKRITAWRVDDIRNLINSKEEGGNYGTGN